MLQDTTDVLEKLGDKDDETFQALAKKGVRTRYENQRFWHLYKLKFIKTRVLRVRKRRADAVNARINVAAQIMSARKATLPLNNKLPDFKVRQLRNFFKGEEGSTKYNLLTNPFMTEEQFEKKFNNLRVILQKKLFK